MESSELTHAMSASYPVKMAALLDTLIAPMSASEKPSWIDVVHAMEGTRVCLQTELLTSVGSATVTTPPATVVMGC